jgi:hypothetical protein
MAWMEVTYETSAEHEKLLDRVRDCFIDRKEAPVREPWAPHASLAYANPESPMSLELLEDLLVRFPTLKRTRRIVGVSLWSTQGTIDQWKCLDQIRFHNSKHDE